ncbi:MAG: acetoacetate--CoA ligase [Saprospiraceae bacterium]|nr:acetoacetate--CoA ligase [Saprospiraceae bacterium]
MNRLLWKPSEKFIHNSNLRHYMQWLDEKKNLSFTDYDALWKWSVDNIVPFWQSIWDYFQIDSTGHYDEVLNTLQMPGAKWFEGAKVNYAKEIFNRKTTDQPAIIFRNEVVDYVEISWDELEGEVASMAAYLKSIGIQKGDRVAAYMPNIPEATTAFLSACSLGAVWSSCSPDFGTSSVVDRFQQIEPKVLFVVDGYRYGGKSFDKKQVVKELVEQLPTVEKVIVLPYLDPETQADFIPNGIRWVDTFQAVAKEELTFEMVPFDHPIWVLYSSGTTGAPKAITHSQGGVLLEHLKYVHFHNDVHPGERFFWFSTTGWMMWNFIQGSFLAGATIVLYDGSPGYPDINVLWEYAEKAKINHFGTSAPFLVANMKADTHPGKDYDLSPLRSIGSTGSPLPPAAFDWVYENIKEDIWLCSMAGGTDVCTAWVGGNPLLPVYEGEIQCRCLGAALYAFNDAGKPVTNEVGEMVITKPLPSMPIYFWNDPDNKRYKSSYFEMYPGIWRHGDWVSISDYGSLIIFGRSDATLNRQGVRIGTAEIYRSVDKISEIKDSLIVNLEFEDGSDYMPLFVVMQEGETLTNDLIKKIAKTLRSDYSPRHVPDEVVPVADIPYTISGKKMEAPVKKILMGSDPEKAATRDSMKNPDSMDFYIAFSKKIKR